MLPVPFKDEIDRAFQQDRNLPRKLLGAVVVGLAVGLGSALHAHPDERLVATLIYCTCMTGGSVLACVAGVFVLTLKDVVQRRIRDGETVNPVLRLYLATGALSLAMWFGTVIVATLLVCILLPV